MQAIHHAAVGGHVELVVLLIEQFGVSPQEKADVCSQPFPCVAIFPLHIFKLDCSTTISSTAKQKDGEEAIYSRYLLSMTMYNCYYAVTPFSGRSSTTALCRNC